MTGASYETEGTLGVVWCGVDKTLDEHSVDGFSPKKWHLWLMKERNSEIGMLAVGKAVNRRAGLFFRSRSRCRCRSGSQKRILWCSRGVFVPVTRLDIEVDGQPNRRLVVGRGEWMAAQVSKLEFLAAVDKERP